MEWFIYVVLFLDYLYTLFGKFDPNNNFCIQFDLTSRYCLDDHSSSSLTNNKITQIIWTDTHLCRHLDSSCMLLNQILPTISSSQLVPEDPNYFTRTLRHFLKISSILLDIAYSNNRLFFLYNSASIRIYNLSLSVWESNISLPLSFSLVLFYF